MGTKLKLVIEKINGLKLRSAIHGKAKTDAIKMYSENETELEKLTIEQIQNHDWKGEIVSRGKLIQRMNYLTDRFHSLERHAFAPELNTMHFRNGKVIKTPQITEVEIAKVWICRKYDLNEIKKMIG